MSATAQPETPAWLASAVVWLSPRRLRAQALVLAVCLWGTCAVDFATPGVFDRAGNIKFQDFLPCYVSGRLIAQGRASELYDQQVIADKIDAVIDRQARQSGHEPGRKQAHEPARVGVVLPMLYGPQVGLVLVPLARLCFPAAAWVWTTASLLLFFGCIYLVWRACPGLRSHARVVAIAAIAFPPLFHFFVRGQLSAVVLVCFTLAFLAQLADRRWLAGIAFGFLVFKPQFLLVILLVLLLAGAWKTLAGLSVSAALQIALAWLGFGSAVMRAYFGTLWHMSRWIGAAELGLAPIQMHSLRSFWTLLIPWPEVALASYVVSSIVVVGMAAAVWKSASTLALRFAALTLASVLANPHLFVYDLLVLAPALLLLVNWTLTNPQHRWAAAFQLFSYGAFVLPLFGPLSRWTHIQFSVPVFAALLWALWRNSADATAPAAV